MIKKHRASGILLHITSLPSDFGIGDLGPWSYRFVDLLSASGQHYWNILPITPTSSQYENSPYQPTSAFAGNTLLLSPELLIKDGLLSKGYLDKLKLPFEQVAFKEVAAIKERMIKEVYLNFEENKRKCFGNDFEGFCAENSTWLDDHTLFKAMDESLCKPWYLWPNQLRDRDEQSLVKKKDELKEPIEQEKFAQFIFFRQWQLLKEYCQSRKVSIFGDLPFYMSYESADVWSHPELFKLDTQKHLKYVGGVPPDYFSEDGQYWGNPVYNWQELKKTNFQWWIERIRRNLGFCDFLRFDHFRGFTAYWQIPTSFRSAKNGRWIRSPSKSFLKTLKINFPNLPFVGEDLGLITNCVRENLKFLGIPGMRVLLFAFDGSKNNPNLPDNHTSNSVVYTGTHDTNTVKGWFSEEASNEQKVSFFKYIGKEVLVKRVNCEFIKLALASKSEFCIIPLQDVFSLGSEARMNHPGKQSGNWEWRVREEQLKNENFEELRKLTELAQRN